MKTTISPDHILRIASKQRLRYRSIQRDQRIHNRQQQGPLNTTQPSRHHERNLDETKTQAEDEASIDKSRTVGVFVSASGYSLAATRHALHPRHPYPLILATVDEHDLSLTHFVLNPQARAILPKLELGKRYRLIEGDGKSKEGDARGARKGGASEGAGVERRREVVLIYNGVDLAASKSRQE
jgi:hypothetical protein